MNIIPITAAEQHPLEDFTWPWALRETGGEPAIATGIEGMRGLLDLGNPIFVARTEHKDRFNLTGIIRAILGRQPSVIALRA